MEERSLWVIAIRTLPELIFQELRVFFARSLLLLQFGDERPVGSCGLNSERFMGFDLGPSVPAWVRRFECRSEFAQRRLNCVTNTPGRPAKQVSHV